MENRAYAMVAGVFVLLFAGAALLVLYWFGGPEENLREVTVISRQSVNGINPQSAVHYRGVRVGKVSEIRFDPTRQGVILLRLTLDKVAPLTDKTVAQLSFQGVTGRSYVQLDEAPGPSRPLPAEGAEIPLLPSLITEGIDAGIETLRAVRDITGRVNALLDEANLNRVARTLDNVEQFSTQAAAAGEKLPEVLARLNRLASDENLARLAASLRNTAETTAQAGEAVREVRALVGTLDKVAVRLDSVLARVDGEALASAPNKVGEMADQVKQAAASVDRVARALEERPEGLIFGKDRQQSGPGEKGFKTGGGR